ncbi:hypothetical protein DFJ74DRAFT_691156 [Hyaloraphidium curvatum]|nr:hypothetical protein DFJ74DRAFT_691156 [Hyaloraphidium curvatum]
MSFAVVACTLLARTGLLNVPRPPPGGYRKAVVPLGVMYAATIALSNSAAKRLSIGAVQMTRSASPVFAYFLSVLWGTEPFSGAQLAVVAGISLGVALATWSEFRADRLGMAFQLAVMVVGNARTVLVRRFLENGLLPTDDALPLLALLAPATLACLAPTALYFEPGALSALASGAVGLPGLAANTLLSFVLNLAMVNMITRRGGALYLGLTMIARDFILILISVAVFAGPFRYLQALGYTIALGFVMVLTNLRGMAKRRGADGGMVTLKEAVAETVRGREIMSVPLTAAGLAVIAAFSDVAVAKAA